MPGERELPPMYVIVVNYNGWRDTIECLESVLASDAPRIEVLICENGSTDGSLERLVEWEKKARSTHGEKVRIIDCRANLGFAGANNVGLRYVLTRESDAHVLLLNNDAVVSPTAIREMQMLAESSETIGAVGCTILQYHAPELIETLGGATLSRITGMSALIANGARMNGSLDPSRFRRSSSAYFTSGCCMLIPRRTLDRVGLMDERYFLYGEDADWGLRIAKSGLRQAVCEPARVWHKGGASVRHGSALHDYYDVRGRLMLVQKHFPAMLPAALVHSVARCAIPKLIRGEWERLGAVWRGYMDFFRHVSGMGPVRTKTATT
jgi:GT2 family glycosyltransferase